MEKHSKRNKSKDNPYTLTYNETTSSYIVEFKDNKNNNHKVEISEQVYEAFDKFELEDISQIHKYRKHIEHNEVYEETLYHRAIVESKSVESIVEEKIINENLKLAINKLTETQKRRIKLYYFEGLTQQEIAKIEKTSLRAVQYTLNSSLKKLKEILKKYKN